eukprot:1195784-Prorocentrum_minimum.AAC.10
MGVASTKNTAAESKVQLEGQLEGVGRGGGGLPSAVVMVLATLLAVLAQALLTHLGDWGAPSARYGFAT